MTTPTSSTSSTSNSLTLRHSCITFPSPAGITIFHCSFCDRYSTYPTLWDSPGYGQLHPRYAFYATRTPGGFGGHYHPSCLHCPHTHFTTHYVYRVCPRTQRALQTSCDRCRIYVFYSAHICWACEKPTDAISACDTWEVWNVEKFACRNKLGDERTMGPRRRVCGYPLDSSCRIRWSAGVSLPVWVYFDEGVEVAVWANMWGSDRNNMVWVEEPKVTRKLVEMAKVPAVEEERKWEEVNLHVMSE